MVDKPQGANVTVLVVHRSDADAIAMLATLEEEIAFGNVVEHLTLQVDGSVAADAALWRAHRAGDEAGDDPLLFERLADIGRIERLRMVAITTLRDGASALELDRAMQSLTATAARLLGADRRRTHARLAIVGYGESMTPASFFSPLADVNAAVLPYDRLEDASIARPVERNAQGLFRTHGAVEIASACGLWRTMESAPLDDLRGTTAAGSVPRIRFLQSRVRLLRTPPLPVAELVAERREIPVPDGFLPVTDAERLMPRLADLLLPPELVYSEAQEPQYESEAIAAATLARILGAEIVHSFLELPGLIWRAVGGEVSTLTRRVLQQAIGETSRYRVDGGDSGGFGEFASGPARMLVDGDGRPVDVDRVIAEPEVLAHFDPIPGEIWTTLVAEVLGSIDGDPDCRDIREQAFGDARFLPVDRQLLLGGLGGLSPRMTALLATRHERPALGGVIEDDAALESLEEGASAILADESPAADVMMLRDREVTRAIAAGWTELCDVAGGHWKGSRATYLAMRPVAFAGGVLTLQPVSGISNVDFHIKRASSPNFVEALQRAVADEIDGKTPIYAIDVVTTLDNWQPMMHDLALIAALTGDAVSGHIDELLERAGLLDIPDDASELRHEALSADELDVLSGFVEGDAQAAFLRDYAAFLRELAIELPIPVPPPTGAPIGWLPPPPSGSPITGLPVPPGMAADLAAEDDSDEGWDPEDDSFDGVDPLAAEWGLLVGIREQIRRQREAAERDVERILGHLRRARDGGPERVAVSPAVPAGAGLGIVLLLVWLGQTSPGVRFISSLGLVEARRDALFTVMTLVLTIGAATLTDLGKRLSGQARAIVLVGASVLLTSGVLFFFEDLRTRVPMGLRQSNLFAFSMGAIAFSLVLLALLQSLTSEDPVRIQGSRVLLLGLVVYSVIGIVVWQVQSRAGLVALDDDASSRVSGILISTALALILASVSVLALVRFREARRRDDQGVRDRWAIEHIGLAVDARERLRSAERQWVVSMVAIAQVVRQPFGPIRTPPSLDGSSGVSGEQVALKAASVQVRLTDRGRGDLESRIRQLLVGPSWLRRRYQAMVDAHQRILATRLGMPVRALVDRRPEADPTVPSEVDLRTARGRGDRLEFIRLAASGAFDQSLAAAIDELDVRAVFEPMLAAPESHVLEGFERRADTVERYFAQLLPESEPTLPHDVVTTVLAAQDRRRYLRPHLWWPTMLPEPAIALADEDVVRSETGMFRHGTIDGAGLVAIRVDVSQEFPYSELSDVTAAETSTTGSTTGGAAETMVDYRSDVGL